MAQKRAVDRWVRVLSATAIALMTSCSGPPGKLAVSPRRDFVPGTQVHKMPQIQKGERSPARPLPPSNIPVLSYYGGNVLSNASVVVVSWGTAVNSVTRSRLSAFYSAVTGSAYFDWLSEYNATGGDAASYQRIGRGSYNQLVTIAPINLSTHLQDLDVQTELDAQISAGVLPVPDSNTLYMAYFPPGVVIGQGGADSCAPSGFCAYHGTFISSGSNIRYAVIPDMGPGSGCESTCGIDPISFNNLTTASSHELVEAVTDPDVGLATNLSAPLAWYDGVHGEIGDICNGLSDRISGFSVQKQWSNQSGQCITSNEAVGPGSRGSDFTLASDSLSASTTPGQQTTFGLTTTMQGQGNPESLTLAVTGLPASVAYSFNPSSLTAGDATTLSLQATPEASPGQYSFTVTANGTSASHAVDLTLNINAPAPPPATTDLVNGGFESGDFTGWQVSGTGSVSSPGLKGNYAARLGSDQPSQDSYLFQAFDVPTRGATLSLWYLVHCSDSVDYDWAAVLIRDNLTGTTSELLPATCTDSTTWQRLSVDLSSFSGHNVTLFLVNHDDNYPGDATLTLFDEVRLGKPSF